MTEMTIEQKEQYAREVVSNFAQALWESRSWQLSQMLPGADVNSLLIERGVRVPFREEWLSRGMEPQEWLLMARAGLGLVEPTDENRAYVREIGQGLAEWLFATPGSSTYEIPASWYETPMGALWAAALIWTEGDELITLKEAAELAGVSLPAISARVSRGTLRAFVNPLAPRHQGRKLVRRSDVKALYKKDRGSDGGGQ